MSEEVPEPVLLGGYAAKQCPVRVHNDFAPLVPTLRWQPTPEEQARLDAGNDFEAKVFDQIASLHADATVIDARLSKTDAIAATVAAMDVGQPLILGGWLPDDPDGARTGKPDILVAVDGGYLPADVKHHRVAKRTRTTQIVVSTLAAPDLHIKVAGWSPTEHRYDDGLQLAHYTRMLEACGHHPGPGKRWGAVLGTNQLELQGAEAQLVFVWHDLDKAIGFTFSRSRGKVARSLLERYDHEHGFRVKVAATARQIVGSLEDPSALVQPVGQSDCSSCPYTEWCAEQMGPDDPSTAINVGRLGRREWLTLRRMGVATTAALSAVDVDDPVFFDDYFAEVTHLGRGQARNRLAGAIERAQMICDGIAIAHIGDEPIDVPGADVEIDVDIEFDTDGRVYMWGARVRRGGDESTARYVADFVEWGALDGPAERRLAERFASWLRGERHCAASAGQTIKVFHWSHPESSRLASILGKAEVSDLVDPDAGVFVDLEKVFKASFFALHGSSLKKVAPQFGFAWRVDDPGGTTSQLYLNTVRDGADPLEVAAAERWLLTYNEDDNAAMAAIRDGMKEWPS